jgi:tetratricopeptide (TPR) repeat protein
MKIFDFIESSWNWIQGKLLLGLALFFAYITITLFLRMRKAIVFEPWMNLSKDAPADLGKSLADLLLFKIREIQSIHQKCVRQIGLWTPYYDVPVFQQELDEDLRLLASFDLGNHGDKTGKLMMFLFRLIPLMFQPAKLKGSIHQYGDNVLLQVTLERFKPKDSAQRGALVWHVNGQAAMPEQFPGFVEDLAYQIYVDLVGSRLFKSWQSFRAYTNGLGHYLLFTDIHKAQDSSDACTLYEEALKEEPNNSASYYNLGVVRYFRYQQDENEKAIECFQRALQSSDLNLKAQAHSGLANALGQLHSRFRAGDSNTLPDAIFHALQAIEIDPSSDVANKALAFAYHQQSEVDDLPEAQAHQFRTLAIRHYQQAFNKNPKYYVAYNNLGNLYLEWAPKLPEGRKRQKCLKRAIAACEKALDIEPAYHHAYDNIANAYLTLGRFDQAERYYKQALQYAPNYPEAKNDLAMLYLTPDFAQKNFAKALTFHIQALCMPDVKATQKAKLCKAFQKKLSGDSETRIRDEFKQYPDQVQQLQTQECSCVSQPTA